MHPHYRGVAFLLSLGTLPIACGKDKDPSDPADTGNGPTGNESTDGAEATSVPTTAGPITTAPPTAPPDTTTTGDPGTTAPPDPSTEPPETTFLTNNSTSSASAEETGFIPDFPPPMNPICQAYADHLVECYPRYRPYAGYAGYSCDQFIMYGLRLDGQACADAIEAAFACFNSTSCDDLGPDLCPAENMAIDTACPNLQGGDTDTDTFTSGSEPGTSG